MTARLKRFVAFLYYSHHNHHIFKAFIQIHIHRLVIATLVGPLQLAAAFCVKTTRAIFPIADKNIYCIVSPLRLTYIVVVVVVAAAAAAAAVVVVVANSS